MNHCASDGMNDERYISTYDFHHALRLPGSPKHRSSRVQFRHLLGRIYIALRGFQMTQVDSFTSRDAVLKQIQLLGDFSILLCTLMDLLRDLEVHQRGLPHLYECESKHQAVELMTHGTLILLCTCCSYVSIPWLGSAIYSSCHASWICCVHCATLRVYSHNEPWL